MYYKKSSSPSLIRDMHSYQEMEESIAFSSTTQCLTCPVSLNHLLKPPTILAGEMLLESNCFLGFDRIFILLLFLFIAFTPFIVIRPFVLCIVAMLSYLLLLLCSFVVTFRVSWFDFGGVSEWIEIFSPNVEGSSWKSWPEFDFFINDSGLEFGWFQ